MRVQPKSEKEIAEANLWPEGVYSFEIIEAEETTSKAGNEMIAMRVKLFNAQGASMLVDDYLVDTPRAAYKVRHCAVACGLLGEYEKGELFARDLERRTGNVKVVVRKGTGDYPYKNQIADYLAPDNGDDRRVNTAPAQKAIDDEIPF